MATAIPTICRELNSASGYAWIGGAYLLGNAAAAPIWAKLSDIWGRKLILLSAVLGYFLASILCALASSMDMLIAGRALQGVAGGGLSQLVNIVISDSFSMRHRGLYLGLCEIIWALAGGVGPVLGGTFAEELSWRWNFWIVLPVCASAFFLLLFALDVHNPRTSMAAGLKAVDWAGSLSILALLIMFLLGLNFGGVSYPWSSPTVICLLIFGAGMSVFFVLSEKKLAKYPLMPLELFRQRSNIASLAAGFVSDFVLISAEFYFPFYLQSVKLLSPIHAGVLILPLTLTGSVSGLITGILMHRTGRYLELIYAGLALATLGYGLCISWSATSTIAAVAGFQVVAGAGAGLLFTPPLIALQAMVPQKNTATATGTMGLVRSVATVLSVVTGQTIFQNGMDARAAGLTMAGLPKNVTELLRGDQAAANVDIIETIVDDGQRLAVKQAFAGSLRGVWILDTCVVAAGLVASVFIARSTLSSEHVETRTGLEKEPAIQIEGQEGRQPASA